MLNLLNKERFFDMISCNSHARRDFVSNPKTLKRRLMVVGIVMLPLSPSLVIFFLVFRFLGHAEQFYNHPITASSRRWSNLSKWIFRESNEKAIYSVATCFDSRRGKMGLMAMVWISQQDSSTFEWYASHPCNSRIDAITDEWWRTWVGWSLGYDIKGLRTCSDWHAKITNQVPLDGLIIGLCS